MNNNSEISVRLCWKFNSFCDIPEGMRSANELFRLAFVFGLDSHMSQDARVDTDNEWRHYFHFYANVISKLEELVDCNSCMVFYNSSLMTGSHEKVFHSVKEYENFIQEMINAGGSDFEAPYKVLLKKNHDIVCVVNTEFWIYSGGRYPYSDSYTHSVYVSDEITLNELKDFINLYAKDCGIKVLPEFVEKYNYRQRKNIFREFLWKILQSFNVFM